MRFTVGRAGPRFTAARVLGRYVSVLDRDHRLRSVMMRWDEDGAGRFRVVIWAGSRIFGQYLVDGEALGLIREQVRYLAGP